MQAKLLRVLQEKELIRVGGTTPVPVDIRIIASTNKNLKKLSDHGLFRQSFEDGRQIEMAEDWLRHKHNWEFERAECLYDIGFGGEVTETGARASWTPADVVMA